MKGKNDMKMRRIFIFAVIVIVVIAFGLFILTSCNKQLIDTKYHFNYAIIGLPDGNIVEGKVDSWTDFEDGDQIQVKIKGITYLVHSSDVILMDK